MSRDTSIGIFVGRDGLKMQVIEKSSEGRIFADYESGETFRLVGSAVIYIKISQFVIEQSLKINAVQLSNGSTHFIKDKDITTEVKGRFIED